MDHRLIDLLVCPLCKGPLTMLRDAATGSAELVCAADRLAFPIRDGIPVMLESEARATDAPTGPAPRE
jgi:uncharacterized protein